MDVRFYRYMPGKSMPLFGMALGCDEPTKGIVEPDLSLKNGWWILVCVKPFPSQPVSFCWWSGWRKKSTVPPILNHRLVPSCLHHGDFLCFAGERRASDARRSDGTSNPARVSDLVSWRYAIGAERSSGSLIPMAAGVKLVDRKDEQVFHS